MKRTRPSGLGSLLTLIAMGILFLGRLAAQSSNSNPLLGAATKCAVFEMGSGKVAMSHGDPTGVNGNLCLGAGGELSMSGGQIITGTAFLDPLASQVPQDLSQRAANVVVAPLTSEVLDVQAAAASAGSMFCDQTLANLKVDRSTTLDASVIDVNGDQTAVVCVSGNMEVNGDRTVLLLTGPAGYSFIFNIQGALKINRAKALTADMVMPGNVLYHLVSDGSDVSFTGGGGGLGCCKAEVDGSILAPARKIALSPGKVNGQVVSARNISLASGSLVNSPSDPDLPQ